MIYRTRSGRTSSGEAIGILLLDTVVPFIPGDVANATTYDFPVRFSTVTGFTLERAISRDPTIYPLLRDAAAELVRQGVRAITGDCGYMALHQRRLAGELGVPVFLSSLLQIPFILAIIGEQRRLGVLAANGAALDDRLLAAVGVGETSRLIIEGLEEQPAFHSFALAESGEIDVDAVRQEVVAAGIRVVERDRQVGAILLECSLMPPYGAALQEELQLPVFDYITMINYVFSAVVKKGYHGFI